MSAAVPPSLAFDEVTIDFAGRRLLRAGEPQQLEPKAFAVLALLAGAPGQAFSRDQILDAVWGHRHVTPGVLNRVMSLLRHALGEEAHTARYLHTLHGVGYRFDLPATAAPDAGVPMASEGATGAPLSPNTTDALSHPPRRPGKRGAPPSAADSTRTSNAGLPVHEVSRPQRRRLLVAAFLGGIVAATGWWTWRTLESQAPPPARVAAVASALPTLIVMPLKAIGSGDDGDIAAGLSDELISALARIHGLRVIARESTGLAAAQATDIAALVPQLGISHALEGSLRRSGERLRIHLRLTEAGTGRTLWVQDYDRNAVDVLALEREIAGAVAAALTLRLGLPSSRAAKGGDAEFLRRYHAARAQLRAEGSNETLERTEAEFRALVKLRPEDARARAGLASVLDARAFVRPSLAQGLRAEALEEADLAERLDPTLPEPYEVRGGLACRQNEWERCLGLYRKAIALGPSDSRANFLHAMSLATLGYLDQARDLLRRDLARDPLNRGGHYALGRVLDTLGDYARAREAYDRAGDFNPYGPWFNAALRGDHAAARRTVQRMDDNPRDAVHGPMLQKTYRAATRALIDPAYWPQAKAEGLAFEQRTGLMDLMRVLHPDADAAPLIEGLDNVRKRSYSTWDLLLWTKSLAYLRRDAAFQDYLRRNGILDYWKRHGFPRQCRPRGDAADCE